MFKKIAFLLLIACLFGGLVATAAASASPSFTTAQQLPGAVQGIYYMVQMTASGGGSLRFALVIPQAAGHSFPKGMALTPEGQLYGTPQAAGQYSFEITVTELASGLHTTAVFSLKVQDSGAVPAPGSPAVSGADSLTGVANGINGGWLAMHGNTLFYVSKKGYLMEADHPFQRGVKAYGAVEYACLDTLGKDLYYFHHYLESTSSSQPSPLPSVAYKPPVSTKKTYVTRIVKDSIHQKGRLTLVELKQRISSLSVVSEGVFYIQNNQLLRADLNQGNVRAVSAAGFRASLAFPFNGQAYCLSASDGLLYRLSLDGQQAQPLSPHKVRAFTVATKQGQHLIYFTNTANQLYALPLNGGQAEIVEGIKASALNADGDYVYFANALDKHKLYRLEPASEVAMRISDLSCKAIYVFDNNLGLEERGSDFIYVLDKAGTQIGRLKR